VVVANVDGTLLPRTALTDGVLGLLERVMSGDVDGDGTPDATPLEEARLLIVPNEMEDLRFTSLPCDQPSRGEFIESTCGLGGCAQQIRQGQSWREETLCRMRELPDNGRLCVAEPLEAAVVALASDPPPFDLAPRSPQGGGVNAVYRAVDDVLVVLMSAADYRDDCSGRVDEAAGRDCDHPAGACCESNLRPVSRFASALRQIVGSRPVVYASLGVHPSFDPLIEPRARLAELRGGGLCADAVPHDRMIQLADELYPDMQLVARSEVCPEVGSTDALARHVLSKICD
jgi:hypothetical protein